MISLDGTCGRIGNLWWINSDPQPVEGFIPVVISGLDLGIVAKARLVRWGTFGCGRNICINMEPIED